MPKALIIGATGQDGAHLARLLLFRGYAVTGTSRDAERADRSNLTALGLGERLKLRSMNPLDLASATRILSDEAPDEIYNLGGQSSVGLSFEQPAETMQSIVTANLNLLEAIRLLRLGARYYNAGSSESFGDTGGAAATLETAFRPRSPYGVAKASAFWQVASWRQAYGLFAVTGVLFNHESVLRPARFVTAKILRTAWRIANGSTEELVLGDTSIVRDFGHAEEYVDAMWRMLQQDEAQDQLIATGVSMSLADFASAAFAHFGLDAGRHIRTDPALYRPNEIRYSSGDPTGARDALGWEAKLKGKALVASLAEAIRNETA